MPTTKKDSKGSFKDAAFFTKPRENPGTTAALAAGIAGVAAAGAFLWSRREQIGEALQSGMDRLSELKAQRMGEQETADETLTLKETSKKSKRSRGPSAEQDIKLGLAPVE
jgi:hypothetical protein